MPPASPTRTRRPAPKRATPRPAEPVVIDQDGAEVDFNLVDFTVVFDRDGEDEPHTFTARPRLGYKQMRGSSKARKNGGLDAIDIFEQLIRPSLLDTDGTPAKWQPEIEAGEFVDPEGNTRPTSELHEVQAFDAGSSRRRWLHLMDEDDDLQVELDQIADVYEKLVGAAADRPTRRRS